MITDKDVADKKNDVKMLRSQIAEHKARRRLDEIEQSELTDASALREANETIHNAKTYIKVLKAELSNSKSAIVMKNGVINEKNKTIDELNETIRDLRMAASDMLDTINECARGEAEDSRVLMKVVKAVDTWHRCMIPTSLTGCTDLIKVLDDVLEDYSDAQESPVVTLRTPSIGTRVVPKNEESLVISEAKMRAVRVLVDSEDHWVVSTDEDAIEVMEQKETIDELKDFIRDQGGRVDDRDNRIEQLIVLNEALRIDIELAHNLSRDHIANRVGIIEGLRSRMTGARVIIDNQATSIEALTKDLDARNKTIKDFKAIEQKETDRLHETIEGNGKIIDELNDMYCDVCDKLERIEKISKKARTFGDVINRVSANHIAIDEITKIIQEE